MPEELSDDQVLFLADILPTAYEVGVLNGEIKPGDSVAVVGAGPIGLATILTAKLYTPSTIIAIDLADSRLEKAVEFGADVTINSGRQDALEAVMELTGGNGVDVAVEAVGVPETFELCTELIRPGGRVANVGVHGHPATLHLETLWIRDVTITTGLVDTNTTPQLLRLIAEGRLDATAFATHRFPLGETMSAYDTFAAAAETNALKVVLEANADGSRGRIEGGAACRLMLGKAVEQEGVFDRIVCGIDESPQSLEALRQVDRLRPADGSLHLVSVAELSLAVHAGGLAAAHLLEEIELGAQRALDQAMESCNATSHRLIEGSPAGALLQEIERVRATVVALGSHGTSTGGRDPRRDDRDDPPAQRALLGAVGACPGRSGTHSPPRSSSESTARPQLSVRSKLPVSSASGWAFPCGPLAASGGKPVQADGLRSIPGLEWDERKPLDALVDASASADLLVVGSRGLHGLAALGKRE